MAYKELKLNDGEAKDLYAILNSGTTPPKKKADSKKQPPKKKPAKK